MPALLQQEAAQTERTSLHDAVTGGDWELVLNLLQHGAQVHVADIWGHTPLSLACGGEYYTYTKQGELFNMILLSGEFLRHDNINMLNKNLVLYFSFLFKHKP